MASIPADPNEAHAEAVADAKRLMRRARTGALATLEPGAGGPLTTLVGVASDFDGAPLFLTRLGSIQRYASATYPGIRATRQNECHVNRLLNTRSGITGKPQNAVSTDFMAHHDHVRLRAVQKPQ